MQVGGMEVMGEARLGRSGKKEREDSRPGPWEITVWKPSAEEEPANVLGDTSQRARGRKSQGRGTEQVEGLSGEDEC